jgi:cytochrome c-type biogenesis protein CcmF
VCAQIGFWFLLLALGLASGLFFLPLFRQHLGDMFFLNFVRSIRLVCVFIAGAFLSLGICFLTNDFNVVYVLQNSSLDLPWFYKFCAVWGGHEGSILLWVFILSFWTFILTFQLDWLEEEFAWRVLFVLLVTMIGFLTFIIFTSNPFSLQFIEFDTIGRDLNPLLQDPGFLLHPPMLYLGYVGYAMPYAFAMAALWMGNIETQALRLLKPWTMMAWCCLTVGITLGSWWAYRELGWGGFWFWDPVENASLMPWLVGTALMHAMIVSEKQRTFIAWTVLLAVSAFALSLIGTFLVRSGVLTSVHAFAVDPKRGLFILLFLMLMMGWAFVMYITRAHRLFNHKSMFWFSKESVILMNNILLFVMMLVVLLGTLYPLIIDGLGLGKLSVGAPYFNQALLPIVVIFLMFMGWGVQIRWLHDDYHVLVGRFVFQWIVSAGCAFALVMNYEWNLLAFIVLTFAFAVIVSMAEAWRRRRKHKISLSFWAMWFAHIGFAASIIGITVVSTYGQELDLNMRPNEVVKVQEYQVKFIKEASLKGPNYHGSFVEFWIEHRGKVEKVFPEKRIYNVGKMVMTDADISANLWRDIYVSLGEPLGQDDWSVRVYYKPLVRWIWLGGLLMAFGGLLGLIYHRRLRIAS